MDPIIVFVAEYIIAVPILAALYFLIALPKGQRLHFAKLLLIGGLISLLLAKLASHFISNPRPFVQGGFTPLIAHDTGNGFPSDHTLLAAFLSFAVLTVRRKIGWVLVGIALLIGLARMAAGLHHSWDILGGFICAAIGCYVAVWALRRFAKPAKTTSATN